MFPTAITLPSSITPSSFSLSISTSLPPPLPQELESTVYHLDRDKSDLSSQLVQLQSVSRSEHEASLAREQDLLEKVADMTVTVADLTSSNTGG